MSVGFRNRSFLGLLFRKFPSSIAPPTATLAFSTARISSLAMSYRPNHQGGRRRGGGQRGGGRGRGGGGRGGRGGEQRWWDPVWRAERLRQQAAEVVIENISAWASILLSWHKLSISKWTRFFTLLGDLNP